MTVATIAEYAPADVERIVGVRCGELAELLGWAVTPPAVRVVDASDLASAISDDVRLRSMAIRGRPRHEGLLTRVAGALLARFQHQCTLGYFATNTRTLFLAGALTPQQAAYVLMHELTHSAQHERFPSYFAEIDTARVRAEDLADTRDDGDTEAAAARDRYESLGTLIEGHATLIGRRAVEQRIMRDAAGTSIEGAREISAALTGLDANQENAELLYLRGERMLAAMDPSRWEALFLSYEETVAVFTRIGR